MMKTFSKNKSSSISVLLFYLGLVSTCFEQQMHITDDAFAETTFAITQIKIPHADKALIEAELQYLVTLFQEALTPTVQGLGVTLADILKMLETQFLLGSGLGHDTDARNKT